MLAQLEAIDGVDSARVDWTGNRFLLALAASTDVDEFLAGAARLLGETTRRLPSRDEREQLDAFARGEPWLRSGETARLSAKEAEILSQRHALAAAQIVGLDAAQSDRLALIVREDLLRVFDEFARGSVPDRATITARWRDLADRVGKRSREFLTAAEAESVASALREAWAE